MAWLFAAVALAMAAAFVPLAIFCAGLSIKNSVVFARPAGGLDDARD